MATVRAINKIDTPIDRGFIIINLFIAREEIIKISVVVIYNYEDCTHSSSIKGLCALYTILYILVRLFISRYIGINKFILHLQNVNIMQLLRIRSGD